MDSLLDPLNDRFVKGVRAPPHRPLSRHLLFPERLDGKPDWELLKDHLQKEGRISKEDIIQLVTDANKIFKNEANLLYLEDPVSIVGDIHGQLYDAVKILEIGGDPKETKYLFLGDYVDRGSFSIEVMILLLSLKINHPDMVYMLRGNHECRQMTSHFSFRTECLYKYDQEVYDIIMDSFDMMPLACIVNGRFLCVHGGLSPELKTIEDINSVDRFKEPAKQGLICDLLWSDPVDNEEGLSEDVYAENDTRGCAYFYGSEAVGQFLTQNGLLSVIRAHEAQPEGYRMYNWESNSDFPPVITIFSAPNYCDVYNNKGAIIKFENNMLNIQQFSYTTHPYILPNFMDVFTWSVPFVSEKVVDMLYNLIKPAADDDDDDIDEEEDLDRYPPEMVDPKPVMPTTRASKTPEDRISQVRKEFLRSKLTFISKMLLVNKTLREENETIVKFKKIAPDNRIPSALLMQGGDNITNILEVFKRARAADLFNERRPSTI